MQRIYLPHIPLKEHLVIQEKDIYHQITRVMRAKVGQKYIFFDGKTLRDVLYEIQDITRKNISLKKLSEQKKSAEPKIHLTVFHALPNNMSKIEIIIQKCSELGYRKICFFSSHRSQKIHISENKKQRCYKIAIEAVEQCWGNIIPQLEFCWDFHDIQKKSLYDLSIVCHPYGETTKKISHIWDISWKKLAIFVWPEWGFTPEEVAEFSLKNTIFVYLWPRILRLETVALLVAFFLSERENISP